MPCLTVITPLYYAPINRPLFYCPSNEVGDSDFEDPQVYESMCIIQTQAGSSETAPGSDLGNTHIKAHLCFNLHL